MLKKAAPLLTAPFIANSVYTYRRAVEISEKDSQLIKDEIDRLQRAAPPDKPIHVIGIYGKQSTRLHEEGRKRFFIPIHKHRHGHFTDAIDTAELDRAIRIASAYADGDTPHVGILTSERPPSDFSAKEWNIDICPGPSINMNPPLIRGEIEKDNAWFLRRTCTGIKETSTLKLQQKESVLWHIRARFQKAFPSI